MIERPHLMTKFTLIKMYPDRSRHVAHIANDDIEDYRDKKDREDADIGFVGGYWLTLPLEPAERRDYP